MIVTFRLNGMDEASYREMAVSVAPQFAAVPGLISKVWLADAATNTYGGVYFFESREAIEGYLGSEIVAGLQANPAIIDLSADMYDTIEAADVITHGRLHVAEFASAV